MKMKKLLASALAAAMVVSSMVGAMVTSAETTTVGTITAGTVNATVGETDTVAVPVEIEFTEGIVAPHNIVTVALQGYTFTSVADVNVTYVEGQGPDAGKDNVDVDPDGSNLSVGKILLETAVDETAPTVTKIAFTANFTDADDVDTVAGTYPITVNGDDMTDVNERTIGITAVPGSLTVAEKEPEHECTAGAPVPNGDGTHNIPCADPECDKFVEVNTPCNYVDGFCSVCGFEDPNYEPPVEECEHANAIRTDITTATATELVFEYTCPDCEKVYPVTHTVSAATYSFGHTLEIQNDITLRFRVNKSALNGYSDIFTVFDKTEYLSGSPNTVRNIVSVDDVEYNSTRYVFAYTGIEAKMMNDSINAKLYAYKDGKYYCYAEDFSVVAYVNGVMPRTGASFPDSLKTALMDMVIYGSKAQDYFDDYNIDNLASDAIPTEYHTYATTPPRSEFAESNTVADFEGSIVTGWYRSLECLNKVVFNIRMAAPSTLEANNYKLKVVYKDVENADQTLWVDGSELVYKNNRWVYGFDKLAVMQFGESFTAVLCDLEGNPVSTTWTTSIEAYVKAVMGSDNMSAYPQDLRDMLVSMLTYGDSAKIYFESTNS